MANWPYKGAVTPEFEWREETASLRLATPKKFDFRQNVAFLGRSNDECLHTVEDGRVYTLLKLDGGLVLLAIEDEAGGLRVTFSNGYLSGAARAMAAGYVWQWFDLGTDLGTFYRLAAEDDVLGALVQRYYGLRLIAIPNLFEAISWAIIGQQINLAFAYTVKRRFVEAFGEKLVHRDKAYWLFPAPERVSQLTVAELRTLQFSGRKAEYIIGLAQMMAAGELSKAKLLQLDGFEHRKQALKQIRGVGRWTANYVLLKCFRSPAAFPIDDAGLHNALKQEYQLDKKPTLDQIRALFAPWSGWEAYATFYFWRTLV